MANWFEKKQIIVCRIKSHEEHEGIKANAIY